MHEPVLLTEVLAYIEPQKGEAYLDMTAGYGGHAKAILDVTQNNKECVLVDRDQMAIDQLVIQFANSGVKIIKNDFYNAAELLVNQGEKYDLILADLGLSSPHLNIASRGFSFMNSGPLDMRMDQQQTLTAEKIVNEWSAEQLEVILRNYGEEPYARKISKSIVANRPINNTHDLAKVIARSIGKWQKKNPATRTFQAIRIAVNNELEILEATLPLLVELLKPNGRLAIISFHSLEDRIVKKFFAENSKNKYETKLRLITKKPVVASAQEIVINPRSRSAKLRVVAKINTTERTS